MQTHTGILNTAVFNVKQLGVQNLTPFMMFSLSHALVITILIILQNI